MWRQWTLWQAVYTTVVAALVGLSHAQHHILPNGGEIKAVLIGAAAGWQNYAIQSDVSHGYQILRENGIPDENIIVMMYDDVAFDGLNPKPGVLMNRPHGPNVYKNVKKDYVGKDVNKDVIFNVLLGNKTAVKGIGSGKVLESGPKDNVLIFHIGHGHPKKLVIPGGDINSTELLNVLKEMANSSRFHKMFIYLEACFSGSMVEDLPKNLNIFAITAANQTESAWMCFEYHGAYLATEPVYHWMQDAETVDLRKETIQQKFLKVKNRTLWSHPQEYGDMRLGSTSASEVLGFREQLVPRYDDYCKHPIVPHQLPVVTLEHLIHTAKDPKEKERWENKLQDLQKSRKDIVQFFSKLAEEVLTPDKKHLLPKTISNMHAKVTDTNLACYENAYTYLNDNCFTIDNYVGSKLHVVINLCNLMPEARLVEAMQSVCHKYPVHQVVL